MKIGEIIYTRSLVQSSRQSIGILPGELEDKVNPYMEPFQSKLKELLDERSVKSALEHSRTMPINFMRGANFVDNVAIIDEAQNCTFEELVTIATRIGAHSRLWFLGDPAQSDLTNGHRNDYNNFRKLFQGGIHEEKGIKSFSFTSDDILRSELCQHVVRTVEQHQRS
jgi:phosphate starvation-inducible PhoH-like protein